MNFNPKILEYKPIFNEDDLKILNEINTIITLKEFLENRNLVEKYSFDFVYTSAKIEGNSYTKAEALTLLEYGKTSGGKDYSDAKMLINLNKAFKYILSDNCAINKHKIRTIHHILADDLVEERYLGSVRDRGVVIKGSDYIPLNDKTRLESELDRMLKIHQSIQNPFDKALYLHNSLAYLQYFIDVNKRTARVMLNLSLICDKKFPLVLKEKYIGLYIEGVLNYYENGDVIKLKEFFIKNYQKVADEIREMKNG